MRMKMDESTHTSHEYSNLQARAQVKQHAPAWIHMYIHSGRNNSACTGVSVCASVQRYGTPHNLVYTCFQRIASLTLPQDVAASVCLWVFLDLHLWPLIEFAFAYLYIYIYIRVYIYTYVYIHVNGYVMCVEMSLHCLCFVLPCLWFYEPWICPSSPSFVASREGSIPGMLNIA